MGNFLKNRHAKIHLIGQLYHKLILIKKTVDKGKWLWYHKQVACESEAALGL